MLPIKDLNRSFTTPHINRWILIINIIIFTLYWLSTQNILDNRFASNIEENFVTFPNEILDGQRLYTLFTSMFMHADWLHLLGNMLFLYIFGDNVEDAFGHISYLAFYIFCGLSAVFAHIASINTGLAGVADLRTGVVGASGAISGILGAYAVLYPKAKVLTIVFYFILPVPAIVFLGFWFIMQWIYGIFDISGGVAYWAHVGGFVSGVILALAFGLKRKRAREARSSL
ncbi:MAG: rhomboid family intramembrane serine protease [Candidatus Bathyarchaeota archaeon]|nr:rhomboid family intramembrane serine protease [Candidatus Bathyarchaeota archaeon]MDH5786854.1 rhomboid family intramembrane serine protease [Candidatus Bathyarchaeota archaeon]